MQGCSSVKCSLDTSTRPLLRCLNGEKVFPEEVEEVLKRHPRVRYALVLGVPHGGFRQTVVAVAEGSDADEASLIAFVKEHLAAFKAPRKVFVDRGRRPAKLIISGPLR